MKHSADTGIVVCCYRSSGHADDEAMQLLTKGISRRHTGETRTNAASSRSHCVFMCILESRAVQDGVTSFRTSRLHLVDLAGSLLLPPLPPPASLPTYPFTSHAGM